VQPLPIYLPSGDLIADRRYQWARDREAKGDLAGAADLLEQALQLVPGYASAWFALGEVRGKLNDRAGAIAAFQKAAKVDPQDRHGAALQLIRLDVAPAGGMPPGYIQALFDGYAPAFDTALTEKLGYRAPELLLRAVEAACAGERMKFGSALDLGCGTGLAGAAFRPFCDWLVGVDLSPGMLAQARGKGLYDQLIESDIMHCLTGERAAYAHYHLITFADVLMYFDDLIPVLNAAALVLAPGGILAFSVETHDGDGVMLRETLRYAHGTDHVGAALGAAGLKIRSLESAATRIEKGEPVSGLIVVAEY
jgi:predicted TPR repeat methyltransferase